MTGPGGEIIDVPMQWTGERNGEYRGTFVAADPGMYATQGRGRPGRQGPRLGANARARGARRRRVLRRDDARRAAAADRRGNRRALLHDGDGGDAARGSAVHRPRRHDDRGARPLAHADRAAAARRADVRRVGLPARGGAGDENARGPECCVDAAPVAPHPRPRRRRTWPSSSGWRAIRSTRSSSRAGPARSSTRPRKLRRARTSSTWPRSPSRREAGHRPIDAGTRSQGVRQAREAAGADDVVFIVLIGHGTFDGKVAKFNLPGPDMTPADFEPLLKKLPSRNVVFVNTASASGPFIEALSGPGRTIVTATRTGAERFATLFGGYFVDALAGDDADADKNRRISVLEAFTTPSAKWRTAYEREGIMLDRASAPRRQRRRKGCRSRRRRQEGRSRGDVCRSGASRRPTRCRPTRSCARSTWSGAISSAGSRR